MFISIILSIPAVQTKIGNYLTNKVNKDFGTDLTIEKVDLSFLGSVQLKGVKIKDHHKDTLIYVNKLSTSILNAKRIIDSEVNLKSISLDDAFFYMKTYKGEDDDNLSVFIDSFDDGKPKDSLANPFILRSSNVYVNNLNYKIVDARKTDSVIYFAKNAGGNLQDLSIEGPNFSTNIRGLHFTDKYGLKITNLTTNFEYTKTAMHFLETTLQTKNTDIKANIDFTYKREDLIDFNNKVQINAQFKDSKIAIQDVKKFYNELNGNDILSLKSGKVNGKLNNFEVKKLNLSSKKGLFINGDLSFVNALRTERGFIFEGDLANLRATYKELKNILPNVLGKTLPTDFEKLGKFNLKGHVKVTPVQIQADVIVNSQIGSTISDLQIGNIDNIDYATYNGEIELQDFNIGVFFNDPLFGKVSLKGDVNGSGFKLDNINTKFLGNVSEFEFKNYNYKNISANGLYQNNKFDGELKIDDTNFKMDFNGLADLSNEINKFDFKSDITYLNLKETNLFTRDSIANLKGLIVLDVEGNTFDDIVGNAVFKDVYYTNQKEEFSFKEFKVSSSVRDSIKRIDLTSEDIANGFIEGKFTFSEVGRVAQNALGSIYANYQPFEVKPNQFLDFNFTIYNQVVNVFFPEVYIDDNTKIKGKIESNKNQLKLTFSSPRIDVYGNELKEILLRTDNQNPFYNSHLTASEVNTKYYKVSKLNLLNKTQNDTLFFKSEFNGGLKNNENFNLDFFYTIDKEEKSVLGFEKSTFVLKNTAWKINPDEKNTDKITFDLSNNEFNFSQFKLTSGQQEIKFKGNLKGDSEKKFFADFTKVKLQSFMPDIDSLALKGKVSGNLDFVQNDNIYQPEAVLVIKDFEVNNFNQGELAINIIGDNSYEKYNVDLSIKNDKVKSIAATGVLDFSNKRPIIDLEVFLEDYQLEAFSPLGQDVISSLRGSVSGNFNLRGFLGNPDMEGSLTLKNAGLKFPYLNIDYDFDGLSVITLDQQSFILEAINLVDTKYKSKGKFLGSITHQNFEKWFLDLEIDTNNLLVLDTQNTEEALYYGTAFMDGTANITGLTDQLDITVNAKTNANTKFVVPLKDVETVDSYSLIHFKTDKISTEDRQKQLAEEAVKNLSLNIDIEVTKDAEAQVVIDEINGSQLSGRGSGNLQIRIDTRGKFDMFGDYIIDNGVYDFKYGGIINKPFVIQKGGTVSWSGNPYEANLDVTAIYTAKANPGVLLENFNSNRKEEIDLVTRITGDLFNSKQELDIQLTNVDPTIASELEFILNDNNVNEKTTQFISLLAFNSFRNPDNASFDVNNTLTSTASSAIAGAFSNLLNSPDSKFQLGLDYQQGEVNDIDRLNIDNQFDLSVSTQVSERVIINGKVGVPVGAETQSSVVGEVKVEVLLNTDGNFRGIIFNRQNEIQYSQEEEGYTQGVGLSYQVNFNTISGLLTKIGLKKKAINKSENLVKKDTLKPKKNQLINFEGN
ncbi:MULTISPECIES: translocation/assembly module TamB domain-containing protein [Polaribacter]|uniref:translocation/assembly module TamB domain-containing protein n=1 Tax=Polaribacter TaxID=52959 RepID=UPI00209058FC|nr:MULTISPECIES: translocation/assembly module TamB [Polaribacter]MDO6742835.1 translocation/assembly module TamB domain-containing protein [Polaribacter sp. 1_MG-2023]